MARPEDFTPSDPEIQQSSVFTAAKIEGDYQKFCDNEQPELTIAEKQRALFDKLRPQDVVTAWECLLAKHHSEWRGSEKHRISLNLTIAERNRIGHLLVI